MTTTIRTLIVFLITAVYAVCYPAIKAGLPFAPPFLFGGLRALIGGLSLLLLAAVLGKPVLLPRRSWWRVISLGLITTTFVFSAMFHAIGVKGAGIASVLGNTQPLIVIILAALFLSERITRSKVLALVLALGGIALISNSAWKGAGASDLSGGAFALAASGGASVGNLIVKRMGMRLDLLTITGWQLTIGGLPLLALYAVAEREAPVIWNGTFVGLLLFLSLVGTALVTFLWYWIVAREDVGRLSMFLFLVPVFGMGVSALVFREKVSILEGIGSALIVAGVGAAALAYERKGISLHFDKKRQVRE